MPSQFLTVALEAAKNAEEIITAYYSDDIKVEMKEDETPVTLADRGAEKVIRETIKRAFPDHGFLGEEYGIEEGDSPYVWSGLSIRLMRPRIISEKSRSSEPKSL